jgi:hypothetical protein
VDFSKLFCLFLGAFVLIFKGILSRYSLYLFGLKSKKDAAAIGARLGNCFFGWK